MDKKSLLFGFICGVVLVLIIQLLFFNKNVTLTGTKSSKQSKSETGMKLRLSSVFVDDQAKALKFYTEKLGFVKKNDVPVGNFRWLTVVSPEGPGEMELLLEPNDNPAPNLPASDL